MTPCPSAPYAMSPYTMSTHPNIANTFIFDKRIMYREFANNCAQLLTDLDYQAMIGKASHMINSYRIKFGDQVEDLYELLIDMTNSSIGWKRLADRSLCTIALVSWKHDAKKIKRGETCLISPSRIDGGNFENKPISKDETSSLSMIHSDIRFVYGSWCIDDDSRARIAKGLKCSYPDPEEQFQQLFNPNSSRIKGSSYDLRMNEVND